MSNLIPLTKNKPNPDLIKGVEDFLEMTRTGEVIGYAGVAVLNNKDILFLRGGSLDLYEMVGALEALKTELLIERHEFD